MPFLVWLTLSALLLSQFLRGRTSKAPPLMADKGLWAPWAGQASTVFSLTALFNAYLAILLVAGIPAAAGLLAGTIVALVVIRSFVVRSGARSFHHFLITRAVGSSESHIALCWLIAASQAVFGLSEFVILKEIARENLSLSPSDAMVFAASLAVIAYFYCLARGYHGVFETDLYQFVFIAIMVGIVLIHSVLRIVNGAPLHLPLGDPTLWTHSTPLLLNDRHAFTCLVGFLTGLGFVISSPDTWKRIFVVSGSSRSSFSLIVLAGILPFAALLPFALLFAGPVGSASPFLPVLLGAEHTSWLVETALTLGLASAFMSSFDSALISSVHLVTVAPHFPTRHSTSRHTSLYRIRLAFVFLAVTIAAFIYTSTTSNPYSVALCLMGPYAVSGGIILGTFGLKRRVRLGLGWLILGGLFFWYSYLVSQNLILTNNAREQMEAVPIASGLFVGTLLSTYFLTLGRAHDKHRH